jgi:tRNA dimethylallyltransferase
VAVLGPTATGKSALAIRLATEFGGEIVNCDSTAVYRRFDIGTDKVPVEEQRGIPHHLIDVADPTEVYSAARYAREAAAIVRDISARGRLPILVGGTGFYYRALSRGIFPGPLCRGCSMGQAATTRSAPASTSGPSSVGSSTCTACSDASIRSRRRGSCRATRSASSAPSRSGC